MRLSNIRNWALRAFLALGAWLAFSPAALAEVCRYQNLMPEFFAFEAATMTLTPEIRTERFMKEFAAKHPAFYGDKDLGWPARAQKDALRLLDPSQSESFPGFPPLTEARLHAVAATVTDDFAAAQGKFLKTFPDFRCQDGVEFGHPSGASTAMGIRTRLVTATCCSASMRSPSCMGLRTCRDSSPMNCSTFIIAR